MRVIVNGDPSDVAADSSVADIVGGFGHQGPSQRGVAVALNGEVVPRNQWSETRLAESDHIEILVAVQGG